jgi:signal peptidase I
MEHTSTQHDQKKKSPNSFFSDVFRFALIAFFIVLPIRLFIAQPFVVSGASMVPTFHTGEYLIVDELSYHLGKPERGEVIIFRFPQNTSTFFIKRVIGLPGERVLIENGIVTIFNDAHPEGLTLEESYIEKPSNDFHSVTLADDEYFVLGDNRRSSSDSRIWGALEEHYIVGRALFRLLPPTQMDIFPGFAKNYE